MVQRSWVGGSDYYSFFVSPLFFPPVCSSSPISASIAGGWFKRFHPLCLDIFFFALLTHLSFLVSILGAYVRQPLSGGSRYSSNKCTDGHQRFARY